jgi:hypothetical protein
VPDQPMVVGVEGEFDVRRRLSSSNAEDAEFVVRPHFYNKQPKRYLHVQAVVLFPGVFQK